LCERDPWHEARILRGKQRLGGQRPQFDDAPIRLHFGPIQWAPYRQSVRDPDVAARVKYESQNLGEQTPIQIDMEEVFNNFSWDAILRIGGELQQKQILVWLPRKFDLQEPVRELSRLYQLGL
jgi:hypothetical protein